MAPIFHQPVLFSVQPLCGASVTRLGEEVEKIVPNLSKQGLHTFDTFQIVGSLNIILGKTIICM
jgi:hypothetical protein